MMAVSSAGAVRWFVAQPANSGALGHRRPGGAGAARHSGASKRLSFPTFQVCCACPKPVLVNRRVSFNSYEPKAHAKSCPVHLLYARYRWQSLCRWLATVCKSMPTCDLRCASTRRDAWPIKTGDLCGRRAFSLRRKFTCHYNDAMHIFR